MHIFISPNKDATLYSDFPTQNTGKDEILEIIKTPITVVSKSISSSTISYVSSSILSRILIQFDLNYISSLIENGTISTSPRFYLNMHVCRVEGQEEFSTLYIYPVQTSSAWVQGVGKRLDSIIRESGVSWIYKDGDLLLNWINEGGDYIQSIPVTASLWPNENNFQESEIYKYELADLRADVSDIVYDWLSGSYDNNGFIIKRSDTEETDAKNYGIIQFYSTDTHTIYGPTLEVAWDDSLFVTGTLTSSNVDDMFIYAKNLKSVYNNREKVRINIGTRELFPSKSYSDSNPYIQQKYLPSSSYYSIIDAFTAETIVPFDTCSTKISCDSNGNFFNLWMNGFKPERYYKLRIKVVSDTSENIYDIPTNFKIVR